MSRNFLAFLLVAVLGTTSAFAPSQASSRPALVRLEATRSEQAKQAIAIATATLMTTAAPLVAIAEEVDNYEYGAVSAPPVVPIIGGILAIATALLPIAMSGGEDAFNEMKEQDADSWGTGNSNKLNKRR